MAVEEEQSFARPQILQNFATYSYYHILVACDSTETADVLSNNTEILRYKRALFNLEDEGKPNAPDVGAHYGNKYFARTTNRGGKYITMIDGSEDADFVIQSAKWATIYSPDTRTVDGESYTATLELDGELEIVEPNGVRFLDVLSEQVCNELETDPNGIVFMLKTIFVGQHASGAVETISTIRPLHFLIIDIAAQFDTSGAVYTVSFVGIDNGVGKLHPVVAIAEQVNLDITEKMSLQQALNNYAISLNDQYDKQLASFAKQLNSTAAELKSLFRLCKYKIELDVNQEGDENDTNSDKYDENYIITDMENIRTYTKDASPTIASGAKLGIEEMVDRIMFSCKKVVEDGNPQNDPRDTKKLIPTKAFKIISRLDSTPEEYIMTYKVIKYTAPVSNSDTIIAGGDVAPDPSQVMQFDYIFTGNNTNILDFKINMNMGMAFFQTLLTTNNVPEQKQTTSANWTAISGSGSDRSIANSNNKPRVKTPLFLGTKVESLVARNNKAPVASYTFRDLMNRWAAFENIDAKMTIKGSAELLDQVLLSPNEQAKNRRSELKKVQQFGPADPNPTSLTGVDSQLAVAANVPTYVKLNIKMPNSNAMFPNEYDDFWYKGFFVLFCVNNIFDDGNFTQELEMFSVPQVEDDVKVAVDLFPTAPAGAIYDLNLAHRNLVNPDGTNNNKQKQENIAAGQVGQRDQITASNIAANKRGVKK